MIEKEIIDELYNKVFSILEKRRTEENKKRFDLEDVGDIISQEYEDYEFADSSEIGEMELYMWGKYIEHLKSIYPDLEIFNKYMVGLKGWDDEDDDEDEYEDETIEEFMKRQMGFN